MKMTWGYAIALASFAAFVFSGCNSSDSKEEGVKRSDSVTVYLKGADWAAYSSSAGQAIDLKQLSDHNETQDVSSSWKNIEIEDLGEKKVFSFKPVNQKYGVAIHCKDNDTIMIYQATIDEINMVDARCEESDNTSAYTIKGNIAGGIGENVSISVDSVLKDEHFFEDHSYSYEITGVKKGVVDLLVADFDSNETSLRIHKFGIIRDMNIDHNLTGIDVNLSKNGIDASEHSIAGDPFTTFAFIFFASKNGSVLPTGLYGDNIHQWYSLDSGTVEGDVYNMIALNETETKMIYETKSALGPQNNWSVNTHAIASFEMNVTRDDNGSIVLDHLSYHPSDASPRLKFYTIKMQGSTISYDILLTPNWLENKSSYKIPEDVLAQTTGWDTTWFTKGASSSKWYGTAIMSNKSLYEIINNQKEVKEIEGFPIFRIEDLVMHWSGTKGSLPLSD